MTGFIKRSVLGIAVAAGFFAAVEGMLAIAGVEPLAKTSDPYVGFAGWSPLFVERPGPAGAPIFETAPGKLRWFNRQRFPKRKAPGVTRVFCVGGSTVFGRPYDDRTSFCGWLRAFLPAVESGRRWEVVNAGGISYASYRIVRLMEELAADEPDLFVVLTGHNEFLEKRTYGRLHDTPAWVRNAASAASHLRLYSVLGEALAPRRDVLATEVNAVLDRSVGPEDYRRDDAQRAAVFEHFSAGLDRMASIAEGAGAGLIFVTPASNIADFSPFKAEPSPGLTTEDRRILDALRFELDEAVQDARDEAVADVAGRALDIDPRNADLLYARGRALRGLGRPAEAKGLLVAARDEDVAPLRAPSPIRELVIEAALRNGAGLVDYATRVEARAPDGLPGAEQFLDHVHPTIEEHRRLALSLIDELVRQGRVHPSAGWDDAARQRITREVMAGVDEATHARARQSLANVLIWAGKHEEAARLVSVAATAGTADAETHFQQATLLRRSGRDAEALPHYVEAVRLAPGDAAMHKALGVLLSEMGRKTEARTELETALRLDPEVLGGDYEFGVVLGDLGEDVLAEAAYRNAVKREPGNADAWNNLGVLLARRGDLEGAARMFERAMSADPSHENARNNLALARSAGRR